MRSKTLLTAALLSSCVLMSFTACSNAAAPSQNAASSAPEESGASMSAEEAPGEMAYSADGSFKPADYVIKSQDKYVYPYLGADLTLPKSLTDKMDKKEVAMMADEQLQEGDVHLCATLTWSRMTKEQQDAEVGLKGTGFADWEKGLFRLGAFGMYDVKMSEEEISEITRCDTHKELGKSSDGKYKYYLSTNSEAEEDEIKEINDIQASLTEKKEMQGLVSVFMQEGDMQGGNMEQKTDAGSIAPLNTTSIDGTSFTEKDFEKYDITMVNVFATWCTACVAEIPDIEKLHQEMKDKGVNVVGVVMDVVNPADGSEDEAIMELARKLQEKTKATYTFLKPDESGFNGRLNGITAFPETFFVDKNGNIVGETYSGSHTYEDWKKIVEKELEALKSK